MFSNNPSLLKNGSTFTAESYFFSSFATLSDQNLLFMTAIKVASVSKITVKAFNYIPGQCSTAVSKKATATSYLTASSGQIKWFFFQETI